MFKIVVNTLKELPLSDKYMLGVSIAILVNPTLALCIAGVVITYFIYKLSKQIKDKL